MENPNILHPQDAFVENILNEYQANVIEQDENRPWGGWWLFEEGRLAHSGENYDRKIIRVNPGESMNMLSLQYHGQEALPGHREIWQALTDLVIIIGEDDMTKLSQAEKTEALQNLKYLQLKAGQSIEIPAGYLHALVNPYSQQAVYLEEFRISPPFSNQNRQTREANITRIYDQTGRDNLPDFPLQIKNRILQLVLEICPNLQN
ncbi:MAG TPA: hypothetical protein PLQ36_03575 [Candidatus Gracilibacteria bacterium]|nr:hypothetical protein [Candidatus Gracilibacteria bacterium]